MRLTKAQRGFLQSLKVMNTAGVYPNVLQVVSTIEGSLSYGQTVYRYKVYNQLVTLGLVRDSGSGRMHELEITTDGLRALEG